MFNSTVLDVAVGLIFTVLAVSLAAGSAVEAVSSLFKLRSRTLLKGVKDLFNDRNFTDLAKEIYNHALINPRDPGTAQQKKDLKNKPAYIEPQHFANALMDALKIADKALDQIKAAVENNVKDPQLRHLPSGMVDRAAGDVNNIRNEIATWFDAAMDRVSGAYKRGTQLWSFLIAVALAISLNISAVHIASALWKGPMITKGIVVPKPVPDMQQAVDELTKTVPIGWENWTGPVVSWDSLARLLGWSITAVATLFGAPFWFDTLQRIVRLEGAGPSPEEKKKDVAAAA